MNAREGLHRLNFLVTVAFYGTSFYLAGKVANHWWHSERTLDELLEFLKSSDAQLAFWLFVLGDRLKWVIDGFTRPSGD